MPPEVPYCRPLLTPLVHLSSPASSVNPKIINRGIRRMRVPGKKLIPLVLILSSLSIFRLLRIAINTWSPPRVFTSTSPPREVPSHPPSYYPPKAFANETTLLSRKEFQLLSNLITIKAPCNLLVFGLGPQYLNLASNNAGGTTIFLEDDPDKIQETIKSNLNETRIHKVEYRVPARKAYNLLKHARRNPDCASGSKPLRRSSCKMALRNLPKEVYEIKWDVVVVDGPSGNSPDAPGRMGAIYTAGLLARAGKTTDVFVHDVDRTIEKWFSWEFLCEENLVSAKGKLWNFRIAGGSNSTRFCTGETVQII